MKVVYFGSDVFLSCFEYFVEKHQVLALYTYHNDEDYFTEYAIVRRAGELGIPVHYEAISPEEIRRYFTEEGCELFFIAEYDRILTLPEGFPAFRGINTHSSLLPQGRSYYPIEGAMERELSCTGVTMHKVAQRLDGGDVLAQHTIDITADTDSIDVYLQSAAWARDGRAAPRAPRRPLGRRPAAGGKAALLEASRVRAADAASRNEPGGGPGNLPKIQFHDPGGAGRRVVLCDRGGDRHSPPALRGAASVPHAGALPRKRRSFAASYPSDGGADMKRARSIRLQPKLLLGLVAMAAVLAAILAPSIAQLYRARMEEQYASLAFGQASVAADLIDGDRVEQYYRTGEKDAYYEEIHRYLQDVREKLGLKYFYVVVPEDEVMYYIWDAGVPGEDGVCDLGDVDAYYGGGNELMHGAFAVDAEQTILITNNEEYGYLASAYVAILNKAGTPVALASVDISMDMIDQQIRQFLGLTLCVVLAVLLLSIFAYYYYVRRILIRPLRTLHHAAIGLVESRMEDLSHFRVEVNTGDELEELAHSFQYMVSELNEYIQNLSRVTAEKERIGAELDVARHIQASMLPCIFPAFPERHEFDIYASMTPAKEVGGDFYDFFLVDDDHLALVMADVSGKGVPAALFMMISKTLLKSAAQSGLSPKAVLEKVNDQLCENNDAEMFVTVWLGILEISTGKMKCANAGHEYPAIMRRGGSFELFRDKHGFVLAGMEGARYREYELELDAGDRLVVYTDGVPEATNASNTLYGTDRMLRALNAAEGGSCRQLLEALHRDVDEFAGGADQFDDITMLCIEMKSSGMKKINLAPTLEQLPQATDFFEGILAEAGASMKAIAQVNVAVDEIFSNIARYSGATGVVLGCSLKDGRATLRFSDNGRPYDPTEKPDPDTTQSAEEREVGGLGIFMVKKLMDEVTYEYADGSNILTLVKSL